MKFQSQIGQDEFVVEKLGGKTSGFYVDIACGFPQEISNTYVLEKHYDWRGISIDNDKERIDQWEGNRSTWGLIRADVFTLDLAEVLDQHEAPAIIDYLSLDLEPPNLTFAVLDNIPWDSYKFRLVTFEHDAYRNNGKFVQPSREFFLSKGYELVLPKKEHRKQEDWWVLS